MFKGLSTLDSYEDCLSKGLCDKHFADFEKESSIEDRHELQRKAFLYIRLRILDPLLFKKNFLFEKMETLISKSNYFSSSSSNQETNGDRTFIDNILLLDSIVVFTLCQFCKICCCGYLFQGIQTTEAGLDEESSFIQKLLNSKTVTENDIRHFNPILQENFIGHDKSFIKFCYVITLLFVRNTTLKVKLKQAITELKSELLTPLEQCFSNKEDHSSIMKWMKVFKEIEAKKNYKESIEAITSSLNHNPYCFQALSTRGWLYTKIKEYKKAQLDSYISIVINPEHFIGYLNLCNILTQEKLYLDCLMLLRYSIKKCQKDKKPANFNLIELFKCEKSNPVIEKIVKIFFEGCDRLNLNVLLNKHFNLYCEEHFMEKYNLAPLEDQESFKEMMIEFQDKAMYDVEKNLGDLVYNFLDLKQNYEIKDVPDLEDDQDSGEETRGSLPDLSDVSGSDDDSDDEDAAISVVHKEIQTDLCRLKESGSATISLHSMIDARTKTDKKESSELVAKQCETKKDEKNTLGEKKAPKEEYSSCKSLDLPSVQTKKEKSYIADAKFKPDLCQAKDRHFGTKFLDSVIEARAKKDEREHLSKQRLRDLLKEGSQMVLDGCGYSAINLLVPVIEVIDSNEKDSIWEVGEIVCIKYACGLAYCSSGGYEDLQKAIEIFKQIIEKHGDVTFPAAYYGMGLAYHKLNKFKDALKYLNTVNGILEKGIFFKAYSWPGLKTVISDTKCEQLKALVKCKIKECEMPPPPDATCRHEDCVTQPTIYYSDPDFKGFINLQCSDQCTLQYHSVCWKSLKTSRNLTDKEFLEKSCLTPDCNGIVVKVEIINKEGDIDKVFRSTQEKKAVKPKKPKPSKKVEEKKKKRQPRKESESDRTSQADENQSQDSNETDADNRESSEVANCEKSSSVTSLSVNAEPYIILKKEKLTDENVLKTSTRSKELKKSKPVTLTVPLNEFYKESGDSQQISVHQPSRSYSYTEKWPSCSESSSCPPPSVIQAVPSNIQPDIHHQISPSEGEVPSDLDCDLEIEDFQAIKNNLYNYLEEFLTRSGPLSIKDVRLVRELETFPTEANIVIAKYGGITEFLKNDIEYRFGIVDDLFVCSRGDLADAYKLSRSSGVMGADNADLLDEYGVCQKESSSKVGPVLNPDAKEYKPSSSISSSATNSYVSLSEDIPTDVVKAVKSPCANSYVSLSEDIPTNVVKAENSPSATSPSIMLAISKLRKPLAVDDEEANNFIQEHFHASSPKSTGADNSKTLSEKCINAVKLYFSESMDSERAYVDSAIEPFKIITPPNQSSKALQTETLSVERESKGTMKTDEESDDLIKKLTEEKKELELQKTLLEAKLTAEMDNAAKCSKKALVEIECLKKDLEESNLSLQALKTEHKNKEMKQEREHKVLMESLNQSSELNLVQEKEINIWCSKNESLQEKMKKMEESMEDILKENESSKKVLEEEIEKYKSSLKSTEDEKEQLQQRARSIELQFLKYKRQVFLAKIEEKENEANSRIKQIQGFLRANSHPLLKENFVFLHSSICTYIKKLGEIRTDLQAKCSLQVKAVSSGALLESLPRLELGDLPEIPCFTAESPAAVSTNPAFNNPMTMSNAAQMMYANPQSLNVNALGSMAALAQRASNANLQLPNHPVGTPPSQAVQKQPSNSHPTEIPEGSLSKTLPPAAQPPSQNVVPPQTTKASNSKPITDSGVIPNVLPTPHSETTPPQKAATNRPLIDSGAIPKTPLLPTPPSVAAISNGACGVAKKSCDNLSLELDYKGKQDSEKTASTMSLASNQSGSKAPAASGKSCDKLLTRLESKYPVYDKAQLMSFIKEFRKNRKGGLSGLTIESIISGVSALIDSQKPPTVQSQPKQSPPNMVLAQPKQPPPPQASFTKNRVAQNKLVDKKLTEKPDPRPAPKKAPCPWANSGEKNSWSASGYEDSCNICLEEMNDANAYRVACGHYFHFECIKAWLNKKSDCPTCRSLVLLTEDYPALS